MGKAKKLRGVKRGAHRYYDNRAAMVGKQVKLTNGILYQFPGFKKRQGTIVGQSRDCQCWWIKWEHLNEVQQFHKSYVTTISRTTFGILGGADASQ